MRSTALVFAGAVALVSSSPLSRRNTTCAQSWDQVSEASELKWQPCFQNYTCARLVVPLDYTNSSAGTTTIAYIKQAAQTNSSTAEDLLINPGGPGESGVSAVLNIGSKLAQIMPQYNIIGFDPRGVNNSGPALRCFGTDEKSLEIEKIYETTFVRPVNGKSEESLRYQYEASTAFGKWCTKFNENTDARYASTVAVAQDMTNYIEKAATLNGKDPKEAKLHYYGVSYGTVLGSTYASLFPTRIGKMALDGVVDVPQYYNGNWTRNVADADKAVTDFFRTCHAAGPSKCALWSNSTSAISQRTRNILETVRKSPVPVFDTTAVQSPGVIKYEDLVFVFFTAMYSPLSNWPLVARILADIETRDGVSTAQFLAQVSPTMVGVTPLIGSLDSVTRNRHNVDSYEKWIAHYGQVAADSEWVADAWAALGVAIKDLEIYPPESQRFNDTSFNIQTSAPILFVSNTHDPATPLAGAQKMHGLFPGSGLLVQDAPGHVASLSAVSECTFGFLGQYFATGQLPPANTTCSVESVPFVTEG